jgi:hypothetical protein
LANEQGGKKNRLPFWSAVAATPLWSASVAVFLSLVSDYSGTAESGGALRLPPQSKTLTRILMCRLVLILAVSRNVTSYAKAGHTGCHCQ